MQNAVVVMRVLRVPPLGKLVVEVNQQRYEKLADISDENVKRLLLTAIGELIVFSDGYENLVQAGAAPPLVPAATTLTEEVHSLQDRQAQFLASLEAEKGKLESSQRSSSRFSTLAGVRPSVDSAPTAKSTNVVEQIDAILQRYLVLDPELAERSIHLQQDASGGLRIRVDNNFYETPKDIEDPKIQMIIRRALKDWEKS
jgi:hypothetical protein